MVYEKENLKEVSANSRFNNMSFKNTVSYDGEESNLNGNVRIGKSLKNNYEKDFEQGVLDNNSEFEHSQADQASDPNQQDNEEYESDTLSDQSYCEWRDQLLNKHKKIIEERISLKQKSLPKKLHLFSILEEHKETIKPIKKQVDEEDKITKDKTEKDTLFPLSKNLFDKKIKSNLWDKSSVSALLEGFDKYGEQWNLILKDYGDDGIIDNRLAGRTTSALRNKYIRMNPDYKTLIEKKNKELDDGLSSTDQTNSIQEFSSENETEIHIPIKEKRQWIQDEVDALTEYMLTYGRAWSEIKKVDNQLGKDAKLTRWSRNDLYRKAKAEFTRRKNSWSDLGPYNLMLDGLN